MGQCASKQTKSDGSFNEASDVVSSSSLPSDTEELSVKEKMKLWKDKEKKSVEETAAKLEKAQNLRNPQQNPPSPSHGTAYSSPQNSDNPIASNSNNINGHKFSFQSLAPDDLECRDSRLRILWSDIIVNSMTKEECILGQGSFGVVIKATWRRNNRDVDVAIKVLTRSNVKLTSGGSSFEDMSKKAWAEVELMKEAERSLTDSDSIVKAYGVAEGMLPHKLTKLFNLPPKDEGVGVVMRYEGGGSLENLLYSDLKPSIPLIEKIRLLTGIAKALVELHSAGIIHADIKSGNVLLSHHNPPEIRLADFGMSVLKDPNLDKMGASSLQMTAHGRGTPVYSAPETLINPFDENNDGSVAQCSRKTDMYSFGILIWEVLARKRPFAEMKNEAMLCGKVHKGQRPPLADIPAGTPPALVALIESCWDKERANRKSAIECLSVLQYNYDLLSTGRFDIFFSHAWVNKPLLCNVYHILTKLGYRAWYDQNDMGHDLHESMRRGIASSKVVIACINKSYQTRDACMFELREAGVKPILSLVTEDNPLTWATAEVQELCKLKTRLYANISSIAKLKWNDEQGPTAEMMKNLTTSLEPLLLLLRELNCAPSMSVGHLSRQSSNNRLNNGTTTTTANANTNNNNNNINNKINNTIWVQPSCPGMQVKIRIKPSKDSDAVGAVKSDQQIEVYTDKIDGYYRLADKSGYINNAMKGVNWTILTAIPTSSSSSSSTGDETRGSLSGRARSASTSLSANAIAASQGRNRSGSSIEGSLHGLRSGSVIEGGVGGAVVGIAQRPASISPTRSPRAGAAVSAVAAMNGIKPPKYSQSRSVEDVGKTSNNTSVVTSNNGAIIPSPSPPVNISSKSNSNKSIKVSS